MTTPTSRAAYKVYYDALDRAIDSPAGIRVGANNEGEAYQYRVRLHSARSLDRELNRQGREPSDPQYGISDYDNLIVRVREEEGEWWVYIERAAVPGVIEELGNGKDKPYTHSPDEAKRNVPLHNLRGEGQPKPPTVDDPPISVSKRWPIRGF